MYSPLANFGTYFSFCASVPKYKMVKLLLVALVLALIAIPFDERGFVYMALRLISFAIIMYVIIKLTSAKKKTQK